MRFSTRHACTIYSYFFWLAWAGFPIEHVAGTSTSSSLSLAMTSDILIRCTSYRLHRIMNKASRAAVIVQKIATSLSITYSSDTESNAWGGEASNVTASTSTIPSTLITLSSLPFTFCTQRYKYFVTHHSCHSLSRCYFLSHHTASFDHPYLTMRSLMLPLNYTNIMLYRTECISLLSRVCSSTME